MDKDSEWRQWPRAAALVGWLLSLLALFVIALGQPVEARQVAAVCVLILLSVLLAAVRVR
jgi:peptidoglycan/LPS O-acetylase OafA/YrhL